MDRTLALRVRAEAAAWLAGLRGSHRTSELEGRFRRWLAASETNRVAWERQNEAWELAGGLRSRFESARSRRAAASGARNQPRMLFAVIAVLSAALVALVLARFISVESGTMATAGGERRTIALPDGSRVTLNADTRVAVQYDNRTRRVRLVRGEALFNVEPAPRRPFIVVVGRREIRAVGTAFDVRREEQDKLAVTLIQGRISIIRTSDHSGLTLTAQGRLPEETILATPGERAIFTPHSPPVLDRPILQQVIAWQSGELVFNATSLPEAVREMNRYSEHQILLEGPGIDSLHIGGLFQAGESVAFARAASETFGLDMREDGDRIILSRRNTPVVPLGHGTAKPSRP